MTTFMTRIELHGNPTAQDYAKLHAAMEQKGFSRTIVANNGTRYQLPTAEYSAETGLSLEEVLNHANAAAATVWRQFSVLTSETRKVMWINLVPA